MLSLWRYLLVLVVVVATAAIPLSLRSGRNLEYEYALAVALQLLCALPFLATIFPRKLIPTSGGSFDPPIAFEVFFALILAPLALTAPGFILFWTGHCKCSQSGFGFWLVLQTVPSWLVAYGMFLGLLRARLRGWRRAHLSIIVALGLAALSVSGIVAMWFEPQKRLTHLFWGFLHGPIYDSLIYVDDGIALARAGHVLIGLTLILAACVRRKVRVYIMLALIGSATVAVNIYAGYYPSTWTGKRKLDQLLAHHLTGEHFTLHYRGETADEVPLKVKRLYRDTEFHLKELQAIFKESPPHIHIYVYPSEEQKKLWFGGGSTDVTDVWTPSVHITADEWPHPTLRHELVHAVGSKFGFHGMGFHPNIAFTEGLAIALAPEFNNLSLRERTAALIDTKRLPSIEALFSPLFWKEAGGRAYTAAGSFIQHLIKEYGVDAVKSLYRGQSLGKVVGKNLNTVVEEWRKEVMASFDPEKQKIYSEALYRSVGVFDDLCPHGKADLRQGRQLGPYVRMRQPTTWDPASNYLPWRLSLDPDNLGVRQDIWARRIQQVATEKAPSAGKLATWLEAVNLARHWPPTAIEDIELAIRESDLYRQLGDVGQSVTVLEQVNQYGSDHYLGNDLMRQIQARLILENQVGGLQATEWRRFLAGWRGRPGLEQKSPHWLLAYLHLRGNGFDDKALAEIDTRYSAEIGSEFALEWHRLLAERYFAASDYSAASRAYAQAAKIASSGGKDLLEEHARRANFYANSPALATISRPHETNN